MAQVTINIPNDKLALVADALAHAGGYQSQILDQATGTMVDNPMSKNQFAKQQVINYMKNAVVEYQNMQALQAAKDEVELT